MSKRNTKKHRVKYVLTALAVAAALSFTGVTAACGKTKPADDEESTVPQKEDVQLLKNGNFEFYNEPEDAQWLIATPNNWSRGGDSSYTMSGIIGTSEEAWKALTAEDLADRLDENNDLKTTDSDYEEKYVDYNGMESHDIPYADTYAALNTEEGDDGYDTAKNFIANPGTHYNVQKEGDSYYYMDGAEKKTVYIDENGDYFLDEDLEQPFSHVLMLHNYADSHNGIAQNYTSVSVALPANTAAEITLWVKTVGLKHSKGADVTQDKGANVTISHTIGSASLDDFAITCINTEKLIENDSSLGENNGWIQYTVYVNACDFADSNITIKLGLGQTDRNVEGYAFFDDVTVTKYISLQDDGCTYDAAEVADTTCSLNSDPSEKVFAADEYERNGGDYTDERYSKNFHYLLDLASQNEYAGKTFGGLTAGLTVDKDDYKTADSFEGKSKGLTVNDVSGAKLPKGFTSLDTKDDLLAAIKAGDTFTSADTDYYTQLNEALAGAADLPGYSAGTDNDLIVLLSRYGATYTAQLGDFTIEQDGYRIISFWVKTSDMGGSTAATVKLTDTSDDENTASFTIDSTDKTTDIDDDHKDIYDGWVQCFFFVHNDTEAEQTYSFDLSFGATAASGSVVNAYKPGWIALTNMQTLDVDETVYGYTGSGDFTGSLTFTEEEDIEEHPFDAAYGSQENAIEHGAVNPSSYNGVNGGSTAILGGDEISLPFDEFNTNTDAGLINREHFANYAAESWYNVLLESFGKTGMDAVQAWTEIFGDRCYQPMVIVNTKVRDYYVETSVADGDSKDNYFVKAPKAGEADDYEWKLYGSLTPEEKTALGDDCKLYTFKQAMNYGFVGSSQSVAASAYATVSVKVKVSKGAVAYVYLTDSSKTMEFNAPRYTFWYNEDGDVLKAKPKDNATLAEQRENVLYTLRKDGLYEADGKYYANLWNYKKFYNDESAEYFDKDGNAVSFDDIVQGETYYADNTHNENKLASHFLTTTDGLKLYAYEDGKYYYIEDGKRTEEVLPFDVSYARYDYSEMGEQFYAAVDARYTSEGERGTTIAECGYDKDGNYVADKWITITFAIHTGNESKNYKLEVWSGSRDGTGVDAKGNPTDMLAGSSVIFDYSYENVTSSNYANLVSESQKKIIEAYQKLLVAADKLTDIPTASENISYYEKLCADGGISAEQMKTLAEADNIFTADDLAIIQGYVAHYYMFSWYDSPSFVPFNQDTAGEDATDYDYSYDENGEMLAYLSVKDEDSYTVYADYSSEQVLSLGTADDDSDSGDEDSNTSGNSGTNFWLLLSSIILAIVLLLVLAIVLLRNLLKKKKKNNPNVNKAKSAKRKNRYMRRLHIKKEEFEEVERESDDSDKE